MSFLTGGSKSKTQSVSKSENTALPYLQDTFAPVADQSKSASNMLANLLGLGDNAAGQAGFKSYLDNSGYDFTLNRGEGSILNNAANRGLRDSGATRKALVGYRDNLSQQSFGNYLQQLLGLSGQGLQAGGLIGGAGQVSTGNSTGSSSSTEGIGKLLGQVASSVAMASDRRLKTDILRIGETLSGLGIYGYRYVWDAPDTRRVGYMADEVGKIAPNALGPELPGGYKTVYYDLLPPLYSHGYAN